jgi:hypothetical protein
MRMAGMSPRRTASNAVPRPMPRIRAASVTVYVWRSNPVLLSVAVLSGRCRQFLSTAVDCHYVVPHSFRYDMTDALAAAHWPRGSFDLVDGIPDRGDRELYVAGTVSGPVYEPIDADSGLFRTFAERVVDATSALAFAREYGLLGRIGRVYPADDGDLREPRWQVGEPVRVWIAEADRMRRALRLWDAVRQDDLASILRDPHVGGVVEGRSQTLGPPRPRDDDQELRRLGRFTLSFLVNERLDEHLEGIGPQVAVALVDEGGRLIYRNRPATLLGALWLQLALAINGNKDYRSCPVCGRWWELDPIVNKINKVYCTEACRQKAWRQRHPEKARRPRS